MKQLRVKGHALVDLGKNLLFPRGIVAYCECGWQSKDMCYREDARAEHYDHKVAIQGAEERWGSDES